MSNSVELVCAEVIKQGRWRIVAMMLAVTWLNPHVYLDNFVVPGSLGGQLAEEPKRWFALGTVSASILWFYGLAILAAWFAPRLRTAKAQRIINGVVGLVMWFIASQLAWDGVQHIASLSVNRLNPIDKVPFQAKITGRRPGCLSGLNDGGT